MPRTPTRAIAQQLDLFRPPPKEPAWQTLSPALRQHTVALLAQLLRGYQQSGLGNAPCEELGDE